VRVRAAAARALATAAEIDASVVEFAPDEIHDAPQSDVAGRISPARLVARLAKALRLLAGFERQISKAARQASERGRRGARARLTVTDDQVRDVVAEELAARRRGHLARAAERLGISERQLRRRMRKRTSPRQGPPSSPVPG
jgi:DNA-binding NtrC family response regulator